MGVVRNNPENIMSSNTRNTTVGRLSPRRIWSPRSKSQTRTAANAWTPQKGCCWKSPNGRQVTLTDSHLTSLTEAERIALRQVALAKLQALNLGCHITLPKERNLDSKSKKRAILLKKRAVTTGFFAEKKADKDTAERAARGMVFGVPLAVCVRNERERARGVRASRSKSTSVEELVLPRSSSRTSFTLLLDPRDDRRLLGRQEAQSYESLNVEPGKRRSLQGLADAFGLRESVYGENVEPQVPDIVTACFRHIESYGLHTLGIFRVSSSRKRIRQLREEFDCGHPVHLGPEQCPHDVATLLKEYFRDLPEPLLTREMYPAFVCTQKVRNRKHQFQALCYLTQLLPISNCDTLWSLLQFLAKVAGNAVDHKTPYGDWVPGNKMDSNNLATLFGPNILHTVKNTTSGEREFVVLTAARADERIDVINAVRFMIEHYNEIFNISAEYLDEAYRYLYEKDPELVEYLMTCRLNASEIDVDFDTSNSYPEGLDSGTFITFTAADGDDGKTRQNGLVKDASSKSEVRKRERETPPPKSESSAASRLFRRRDKSASRSPDESSQRTKSSEERSGPGRWFRRRERSATKNLDSAIDAVNHEVKGACDVGIKIQVESDYQHPVSHDRQSREQSPPSRMRPLTVPDDTKVDSDYGNRKRQNVQRRQVSVVDIRKERLSAPEVRNSPVPYPENDRGVITASLTLKVPLSSKVHASTVGAVALRMDDRDIPFIEDVGPDQDLESTSLKARAQPYTERRHRSTPYTDADDHVTVGTRRHSGSSDPSSESNVRLRSGVRKPHYSQDSVISSDGTSSVSTTSNSGSLRHTPSSDYGCPSSFSGESTPLSTGSPPPWNSPHWSPASPGTSPTVPKRVVPVTKPERRRRSGSRSSVHSQGEVTQETWKRWEIISSEHTEQETLV